jgi:redox-sensitive bicupin YhaK (pirin superfamily)
MTGRRLRRVIPSVPVSDGAGVRLRRSLGQTPELRLDPFLLLDEFASENPGDYVAGFPDHPHRGFETVTYMLEGHLLHEDHLGHRGQLRSGGAQWMTAGRGIIHSEMPQQQSGRLHGFQLWINLPAREKLKPAAYRNLQPEDIPQAPLPGGGRAKVIAGALDAGGITVGGPIRGLATAPLLLDLRLPAGACFSHPVPAGHNAFVYAYQGRPAIGSGESARPLNPHEAGVLSDGEALEVVALDAAGFLLAAARPLREPVVQYGPFVMNTREEIERAIADYQNGELV